jgi:hypothetical protein
MGSEDEGNMRTNQASEESAEERDIDFVIYQLYTKMKRS